MNGKIRCNWGSRWLPAHSGFFGRNKKGSSRISVIVSLYSRLS